MRTSREWLTGSVIVSVGTVLSAALGWLLFVGAARILGPAAYADFAVLWAFFFGLSGLLGGLQQEVTRTAVRRFERSDAGEFTVLGPAVLVVGSAFLVAALVTAIWAEDLFGGRWPWVLLAALAGLLGYTVQAAVMGGLAARGAWSHVSTVTTTAAALRLVAVLAACAVSPTPPLLVLAIGAGALAVTVLLPLATVRAGFAVRGAGGVRAFAMATTATMGAGLAIALLTSGFPFLVDLLGPSAPDHVTGPLYASLMTVRTPIVMPILGLQLLLVTLFVQRRERITRPLRTMLVAVAVGGTVVVGAAGLVGPAVLELVLGDGYRIRGTVVGLMASSAVLLAGLVVTSTALVATDRHRHSTTGWMLAVIVSVLALGMSEDVQFALLTSAVAGPFAGLVWHSAQLSRRQS